LKRLQLHWTSFPTRTHTHWPVGNIKVTLRGLLRALLVGRGRWRRGRWKTSFSHA